MGILANFTTKVPVMDSALEVQGTPGAGVEMRPKVKRSPSPTARTREYLKARGYSPEKTEHYNVFCKRFNDLFGFIDILCQSVDDTRGMLAFQATSDSNHAARRTKILGLKTARKWVQDGNFCYVISWKKGKPNPRLERILLEDFK